MKLRRIVNGPFATNSYLIETGEECVLIDAPSPSSALSEAIRKTGKPLKAIILTHGHFDHVLAAKDISDEFGAEVFIGERDAHYFERDGEDILEDIKAFSDPRILRLFQDIKVPERYKALKDGDAAYPSLRVMETPGHTEGGISLYSGEEHVLFSGDTLFKGSIGRTDLGGNYKEILESLKKYQSLPKETLVLPGHGPESTLEEELRTNPYFF